MKNTIIGLAVAAVLAMIGWYWYNKRKNTDAATKESKSEESKPTTEPTKPTSVATKPTLATAEQIAQSATTQIAPQLTLQIER